MEQIDDSLLYDLVKDRTFEGELPAPATSLTLSNPLCGDEVTFYVKPRSDGQPELIQFKTKGCFICKASAASLVKASNGRGKAEILSTIKKFRSEFLDSQTSSLGIIEFEQLHHLRQYPTRAKCVLLPFEGLLKLLSEE